MLRGTLFCLMHSRRLSLLSPPRQASPFGSLTRTCERAPGPGMYVGGKGHAPDPNPRQLEDLVLCSSAPDTAEPSSRAEQSGAPRARFASRARVLCRAETSAEDPCGPRARARAALRAGRRAGYRRAGSIPASRRPVPKPSAAQNQMNPSYALKNSVILF